MKNFFKKLSFVLAIAMVLTSIAPATASAAGKTFIYKSGKVSELADGYALWIGDKATDLNALVNGKKNVAGTWKVGNTKIATIDKETGVITPVKNGTTTVRFTAKNGETDTLKVVVGTRAAGIKVKDNGVAITELTMTAGETKELKFGAYISGKAKAAGAKKATQAVDFTVDGDAVTTERNGNYVTVTAEEAGEATITFTAGKKTATVKVTVEAAKAELSATQTGVKKITVTGSDLTANKADYSLKRGNVTVTIDKVELNEEKTEAVLVAASAKYPAGNYVVTFAENTTEEFTVEDGKLTKVIVSPNLVLDGTFGIASSATVSYRAENQFEEDITKTVTTLNASCTLGTAGTPNSTYGFITVTNISTYYQLGQSGKIILIDTAGTGVTVEADVELSSMSVPADVILNGVYNTATKKYVDLKANEKYDNLALAVNLIDQYNNPVITTSMNSNYGFDSTASGQISLIVNPVLTGFTMGTSVQKHWDKEAGAYLIPIGSFAKGALKEGTVTFTFVLKGAVKNISKTIEIASTPKVANIEIYPLDTVYYGEENAFGYNAFDNEGNEVTSYALLRDAKYGVTLPNGFTWRDDNFDDVAELYYNGTTGITSVPENTTGMYSGMVASRDYSFNKTVQFSYSAKARPAYVTGVGSHVSLGVITGSSVDEIAIGYKDVVITDQYGRVMSNNAKKNFTSYTVEVNATSANGKVTSAGSITLGSTDVVTFSAVDCGYETFALSLNTSATLPAGVKDANNNIKNSDTEIKICCVTIYELSNFEVDEIGTLRSVALADGTLTMDSRAAQEVAVYGYTVDGVKVKIPADGFVGNSTGTYYSIVSPLASGASVKAANVAFLYGYGVGKMQEGSYPVDVVINNGAGTKVSQTVTVKYAEAQIVNVANKNGENFIEVATQASISVVELVSNAAIGAVDQFGYTMGQFSWGNSGRTINGVGHTPSVYIYDVVCDANPLLGVTNNNTKAATIDGTNSCTFMVKLTFDGGYEFTTKVVVGPQ